MGVLQKVTKANGTTGTDCTHHWVVAQPNGPMSKAKCKKCGTKNEFSNTHAVLKQKKKVKSKKGDYVTEVPVWGLWNHRSGKKTDKAN